MTGAERGFLLLTSSLGDPERKPLTAARLRQLGNRVQGNRTEEERQLTEADLKALGCGQAEAQQILKLLGEEERLEHYLRRGHSLGYRALTPVSPGYPAELRQKLGWDMPGCLWIWGDLELLQQKKIALVGSRDILPENRRFAWEAGQQAAEQGYVLVSGNARGADRLAQTACLRHGGRVICILADGMAEKSRNSSILYISEGDFDLGFSVQRALRRNRIIHALGEKTLVAQCSLEHGGTWDGTVNNLKNGWSPVFCLEDGSAAAEALQGLGALLIPPEALSDLGKLHKNQLDFLN